MNVSIENVEFESAEIVELVSTNDFTEKEKMEMLCWLFPMFNNRKQTNKGKLMADIIQFINDNCI